MTVNGSSAWRALVCPVAAALFRIYALLGRAKGEQVTARDVHDAWAAWALQAKPDHPAIVPFEKLSPETQAKDEPYAAATSSSR